MFQCVRKGYSDRPNVDACVVPQPKRHLGGGVRYCAHNCVAGFVIPKGVAEAEVAEDDWGIDFIDRVQKGVVEFDGVVPEAADAHLGVGVGELLGDLSHKGLLECSFFVDVIEQIPFG